MKIVNQSYEILTGMAQIIDIPYMIEVAGRTCYKSEDKISEGSADKFCRMLIKNGHESMIEHGVITVRFITDRGVSHELVRHRVASFAQESTRYVKYDDMEIIRPVFEWAQGDLAEYMSTGDASDKLFAWYNSMQISEESYKTMIELGCKPQEARSVLPNSLKTEVIVTADIREWRHILKLRTSKAAHPQIRKLMLSLLAELKEEIPSLFGDIEV